MTGMNPLGGGFHFQVGFGQHLWNDLFSAALPVQVGTGAFDVTSRTIAALGMVEAQLGRQLREVSTRTQPLLPPPIQDLKSRWSPRIKDRAKARREQALKRLAQAVKVTGDWNLHITQEGTQFAYAPGAVSVSAQIRAEAIGTIQLEGFRRTYPFRLERMVRGSFDLRDIGFDRNKGSLNGHIRNLHLELGQNPAIKLAERYVDKAIAGKIGANGPIPMLKVAQINESLSQALGNLSLAAAIDDVDVEINDRQLLLKINFLFKKS